MRDTTCPGCRRDVPAGRWCNRCGAALEQRAASVPSDRRWGLAIAGVVAAIVGVGALVTAVVDDAPAVPTANQSLDSAVVLAEDPPPPPAQRSARPTPPPTPPGERVDVICSDLRVRSVPIDLVSTDEPGELVDLANGTCVVMGPNGAVAP